MHVIGLYTVYILDETHTLACTHVVPTCAHAHSVTYKLSFMYALIPCSEQTPCGPARSIIIIYNIKYKTNPAQVSIINNIIQS